MSSRDSIIDRWLHGTDWISNRAAFAGKAVVVMLGLFALMWFVSALILGFVWLDALARGQLVTIGAAKALSAVGFGKLIRLGVELENNTGGIVHVTRSALVIANSLPETWNRVASRAQGLAVVACIPAAIAAAGYLVWSVRAGMTMGRNLYLRGARMVEPEMLNQELADAEADFDEKLRAVGKEPDPAVMRLQIGPINLPKDREVQGFYISGSTGSGKTVAQKSVMDQVRALNQKMIVYDPKPEFVREFWRPGDVILNPLDERGVFWEPWNEIRKLYDYRSFAESLIELDPKYASFAQAAQTVLSAMLSKTSSIQELVDVLRMDTEETEEFLVGTPAQGVISAANARGSDTVLSMIRQKLSIFNYMLPPEYALRPGEQPFSLRDWVSNHDDRRWVFMVAPEDQRRWLRPLITLWFDIVSREIMSLVPNNELPVEQRRRIWLMLEEFPSLPAIPSLEGLTAKGRAYGAVWMITVQDPGQLENIYGSGPTQALLQNCNTWMVFRANNALTAKMVSAQIGQFEEWEKTTSYSFGVAEERDGASYTEKRALRDAVLPSEIQRLPDLNCYVILYGAYPATRIQIPYIGRKETQDGSVMRPDLAIGHAVITGEAVVQPREETEEQSTVKRLNLFDKQKQPTDETPINKESSEAGGASVPESKPADTPMTPEQVDAGVKAFEASFGDWDSPAAPIVAVDAENAITTAPSTAETEGTLESENNLASDASPAQQSDMPEQEETSDDDMGQTPDSALAPDAEPESSCESVEPDAELEPETQARKNQEDNTPPSASQAARNQPSESNQPADRGKRKRNVRGLLG